MKRILGLAALMFASALFLTNCSKDEGKGKYYGVSDVELGELVVVGSSQVDMTTTGTSFVQALQAITGKQPTPYYKDTVKMKGDMRCVVRAYDGGSIQGVFHFYEGTEEQIKNGTGTPVDEFSLEFSNEYKNLLQQLPYETDLETDASFIQYMYPQGGQQKSICIGQINKIPEFVVDIPGGGGEIPIKK